MIYVTTNSVIELLCLLIACFCLFKDRDAVWRLFILYITITCVVELTGIHFRKVLHRPNYMVYNIFIPIEGVSISCFFYHLFKEYKDILQWLLCWIVIFLSIFCIELYLNMAGNFVFVTEAVMSVIFVLAGLYYYYLMVKDEGFRNLNTYDAFWWINGTIFFYFGSTVCNIFFDFLIKQKSPGFTNSIRYIIFTGLDVILYCLWSYAFICRYRQQKLSS